MIGDAIQVLFNAPGDQPDYASRAIACAEALDDWAEAFRERWMRKGVDFGATRIGVHAGAALVGNFGGDRFFDYTAYGDTINTAARLEAANKPLGTRICVSDVAARAAGAFRGRPIRRSRSTRPERQPCGRMSCCRPVSLTIRPRRNMRRRSACCEAGDVAALPTSRRARRRPCRRSPWRISICEGCSMVRAARRSGLIRRPPTAFLTLHGLLILQPGRGPPSIQRYSRSSWAIHGFLWGAITAAAALNLPRRAPRPSLFGRPPANAPLKVKRSWGRSIRP